jgi:hypothetical protein
MTKATLSYPALPVMVKDQLQKLGRDLALARKRRRTSLRLWVLGMHRRLGELAAPETDATGLQEDIRQLPRDFRKTKKRDDKYDF